MDDDLLQESSFSVARVPSAQQAYKYYLRRPYNLISILTAVAGGVKEMCISQDGKPRDFFSVIKTDQLKKQHIFTLKFHLHLR